MACTLCEFTVAVAITVPLTFDVSASSPVNLVFDADHIDARVGTDLTIDGNGKIKSTAGGVFLLAFTSQLGVPPSPDQDQRRTSDLAPSARPNG